MGPEVTMGAPLATPDDVAILWPFDPSAQSQVSSLCAAASALLRQKVPWVDLRMQMFAVDSSDTGGLDPAVVTNVVATMVKRVLSNPDGATNSSESETVGPYSTQKSRGYALRGDKDVRGELMVTDSDLDKLTPPRRRRSRVGTIKMRGRMAPWPAGDYGNPALAGSTSTMDAWLLRAGLEDPAGEVGPFVGYDPEQ